MSNLNRFLKVLNKVGYPNSDLDSIVRMVDYDLYDLLLDLVNEVGEDGADDFIKRAISKVYDGDKGIRVAVNDGDYGEYAYIKLENPYVDLENDDTTVLSRWSWGETKILTSDEDGNEIYKTMDQISDETDMGDWGEYEELIEHIKTNCNDFMYRNCGFVICWDEQ
jgi:hypothetical protein